MLPLRIQEIPSGNGCTSRVSDQVRYTNGKTIKWTSGSGWISAESSGASGPQLNALQPEFPGLQMEMEADPPG